MIQKSCNSKVSHTLARRAGSEEKVAALETWRSSNVFDDRERAALEKDSVKFHRPRVERARLAALAVPGSKAGTHDRTQARRRPKLVRSDTAPGFG